MAGWLRRQRKRATRDNIPSRLVAVVNGREHVLGPTDLLCRVRVGSAAGNAVVVNSDGVEPHHIEIQRKGPRWRVRNLSKNAVEINGSPLPGRERRNLTLPALIGLTGNEGLRLFLRAAESAALSGTSPQGA